MTLKEKIKRRRRKRIREAYGSARRVARHMATFEQEVRRIHPECATPVVLGKLIKMTINLARQVRRGAKAQAAIARVYAAVNEDMV